MNELHLDEDLVDFGPLPPSVNALLQQGVATYITDPPRAEACFRAAIDLAPNTLTAYRCLVKFFNRHRRFEEGLEAVADGMHEAARQSGIGLNWPAWRPEEFQPGFPAQRFLLMSLKALGFLELRRGNPAIAQRAVAKLMELDPQDGIGWSVVAALLPDENDAE